MWCSDMGERGLMYKKPGMYATWSRAIKTVSILLFLNLLAGYMLYGVYLMVKILVGKML